MLIPQIAWLPVGRTQFIAWIFFYGLLLFFLATHFNQPTLLDNVHLVTHEAGHLLFGWFGQAIGLWGGTLLQLLVPASLAVAFAARAEISGVAFCSFAFFHSLTGVAMYMSDALRLELPLVTVGAPADEADHDWVVFLLSSVSYRMRSKLETPCVSSRGWACLQRSRGFAGNFFVSNVNRIRAQGDGTSLWRLQPIYRLLTSP